MSFSVAGKVAIVTGAANGVGLAIGQHLAQSGAKVMLADMDEAGLIAAVGGDPDEESNISYFAADLREKLSINNLLSATIDAYDQVDILVNASRQFCTTDLFDPEDDNVDTLLQQNLFSALRISKIVAKRMIKQAKGSDKPCIGTIINLSSIASHNSRPQLLGYSISSAALDQLTRSLALTLAQNRIRVNAVAFGSVMSASLQNYLKENTDHRDDIITQTPLGRIASANEVAEAVQFLASDSSSFVTGQILNVDGGRSLLDAVSHPAH